MIIDPEDQERFDRDVGVSIHINKIGYAKFRYKGKTYLLHRWIMDAKPGQEVSHLDGDKLNNSKSNLKICSSSENKRNLNDSLRKDNTSELRGVTWHEKGQKWKAQIKGVDKENIHLGCYDTVEEAHAAYLRAAERLGYQMRTKE